MATCSLKVILFPKDGGPPQLVPMKFDMTDKGPSSMAKGEIDRILASGTPPAPGKFDFPEYHIIAPKIAGIDSDQSFCEKSLLVSRQLPTK